MPVDKYKIFEELDYLLASYPFRNKPQIQRLLMYLVEHASDEGESAYDQRAIAVDCLGRNSQFDPAENPVVRIEIGRLRKLLNHFYSENPSRQLLITIPLGQYRPVISEQLEKSGGSMLPELVIPPAQPESLSLLLQFETNGEESPDLYLLRHQIRIGLTVHIGRLNGVRLVVALPDEDGKITSHVDFVVRVSVGGENDGYQVFYSVASKETGGRLFEEKIGLPKRYDHQDLDKLICLWGTDLLDREVGLLWVEWVRLRDLSKQDRSPRVEALVNFQKYMLNETPDNLEAAFFTVFCQQREDPHDSMMNTALSELYYRVVVSGSDVVQNPVSDGLLQVRTSLRTSPACPRLHLLSAFMLFFSKEHEMSQIELSLCLEKPLPTFSFKFHSFVLLSLMSGTDDGLDQLKQLCQEAGVYPQLYVALLYLNSMLNKRYELTEKLSNDLDKKTALPMLLQCIANMKMPAAFDVEGGRELLRESVLEHLKPLL